MRNGTTRHVHVDFLFRDGANHRATNHNFERKTSNKRLTELSVYFLQPPTPSFSLSRVSIAKLWPDYLISSRPSVFITGSQLTSKLSRAALVNGNLLIFPAFAISFHSGVTCLTCSVVEQVAFNFFVCPCKMLLYVS